MARATSRSFARRAPLTCPEKARCEQTTSFASLPASLCDTSAATLAMSMCERSTRGVARFR